MVRAGTAYVDIRPDWSSLDKGIDQAAKSSKAKFAKIGKAAAAGVAAGAVGLAALGKTAVDTASDIAEAQSKNRALFGDAAKGINEFAKSSAKSYGISKSAALEYTGSLGGLLKGAGLSEAAAAKQSVTLSKLAADMASFNNMPVTDALDALRSGLVGESEPLRKFGVTLNEAALKTKALELGLVKSTKDALSPYAKAMATVALTTQQTKDAQGDFARTSGGLAAQQKILSAQFSDMGARLGTVLLPAALKATSAFVSVANAVQRAWPQIRETASTVFGAVSGAVTKARIAITGFVSKNRGDINSLISAFRNIASAVRTVFNDVIVPIIKRALPGIRSALQGIITTVRGVIRVFSGIFTGDFGKAWAGVKDIFRGGVRAIAGILRAATAPFREIGSQLVGAIVSGIKSAPGAIVDAVKSLIPAPIRKVLGKAGGVAKDIVGFLNPVGDPRVRGTGGNMGDPPRGRASAASSLQLAGTLARKFGLRVTSGYRSPAHNRAVGGVAGSYHTRGTPSNPGAVDLVGSGSAMQAASAYAARHFNLAENLIHDAGSGLHLHLGFASTAVRGTVNAARDAARKVTATRAAKKKRRNVAENAGLVNAGGRVAGVTGRIAGEGFAAPSDFSDGFIEPEAVVLPPTVLESLNARFSKELSQIGASKALAGLTDTLADDFAEAMREREVFRAALEEAKAAGDAEAITQFATALKQSMDATAALAEEMTKANAIAEEERQRREVLISLQQEVTANQRKLMALASSQPNQMVNALIEVLSGGIGAKVGLGVQTPGFAGHGVRY
jgi:hypothetical protein